MQFLIDTSSFSKLPALTVHGLRARGLRSIIHDDASASLRDAADSLNLTYDAIAGHPQIVAWREAYRSMGVRPSKYYSSIEALLRRTLKGANVATGVDIVDLYNLYSIRAIAPMGAYDCKKIGEQQITLRPGNPEVDHFVPLGRDKSGFRISSDILVYALGSIVLCWSINCRDSELSALENGSDDVVFFSEGVNAIHKVASQSALDWLRQDLESRGARCSDVMVAEVGRSGFVL